MRHFTMFLHRSSLNIHQNMSEVGATPPPLWPPDEERMYHRSSKLQQNVIWQWKGWSTGVCFAMDKKIGKFIEEKMKLCLRRVGGAEKELSQVTFLWGNIKIIQSLLTSHSVHELKIIGLYHFMHRFYGVWSECHKHILHESYLNRTVLKLKHIKTESVWVILFWVCRVGPPWFHREYIGIPNSTILWLLENLNHLKKNKQTHKKLI